MNKQIIPFAKVFIGESEQQYLKEVIESGWLTTASKTLEFEKRFADYVDAKFACAVNSCTSALHLAIDALGVKPNDRVFVPSMTFTATAEIIRYMSAHPLLLDVEYATNLITPEILKKGIKEFPDVKHIILVHYGGQAAQIDEIVKICRENNIKIIEDAAHAFPTRYKGKMIGSFGDITCFSFYANKTITTGEGGMLTTDSEELFKRIKIMRLHGINRDIWDRFTSKVPSWEYDVVEAGYKYNMPDINAAIGLGQLEKAEEFRKERQRVAEYYYNNLSKVSSIDLPICKVPFNDHSWHLFPIIINENSNVSRNQFIEMMSNAGIGTSVHYKPLHQMTYYKIKYNLNEADYPISEKTWKGNVSLPIYPYLTNEQLSYICFTIKSILS